MTVAVVVFPGTNCERDVASTLRAVGADVELVFHRENDLSGATGVVLPGGFAHGDYLRTGAIARFSPVMAEVERLAAAGAPILGICNGFQILCEAGLLPGALLTNAGRRFICRPVDLVVTSTRSVLTASAAEGAVLRIPLNSYEGAYHADVETLDGLEETGRVVLRYAHADGSTSADANPNGSDRAIAGITSEGGNVAGLMPHPERASDSLLSSVDGLVLLESFVASLEPARA